MKKVRIVLINILHQKKEQLVKSIVYPCHTCNTITDMHKIALQEGIARKVPQIFCLLEKKP